MQDIKYSNSVSQDFVIQKFTNQVELFKAIRKEKFIFNNYKQRLLVKDGNVVLSNLDGTFIYNRGNVVHDIKHGNWYTCDIYYKDFLKVIGGLNLN